MKYRVFIVIFGLLFTTGCTTSGLSASEIPKEWTYFRLENTPFEVPMPKTAFYDSSKKNFILSEAVGADGNTLSDQFFDFVFEKVKNTTSLDEYSNGLCYSFDGISDMPAPFGRKLTYATDYIMRNNNVEIYSINADCSYGGFISTYVIIYGNEVYHVGVIDSGRGGNGALLERAILNIRPVQTPK